MLSRTTLNRPLKTMASVDQIRHPLWRWLLNKLRLAGVSRISLILPGSVLITLGEAQEDIPAPTVELKSTSAIRKAVFSGVLGWGEAYVAGDWDTPDLSLVTEWALSNEHKLESVFSGSGTGRWLHRILHRLNDNTLKGSRRNIQAHYDLGNDFYKQWLDSTMSYSSGLYRDPGESLYQAQQNKYDRILELLQPEPDSRVLEIGCGWGGFAERLLQHHPQADYHGITLSSEQLEWTRKRLADQHLDQRGMASLTDYREVKGQYDRIASVEMIEAVGEAHWPTYFKTVYDRLLPGGRAVLQVITIAPERFDHYRNNADFIQRYIFPGGMLLTPEVVSAQASQAGLSLVDQEAFGQDYARTLFEWRNNFEQAWPDIQPLGFDEHFRRLWRYYLCYCESGFNHQSINVYLFTLQKPSADQTDADHPAGTTR